MPDLVIGHAPGEVHPTPGMWRARCECLREFRAPTRDAVIARLHAHIAEMRAERMGDDQ